MHREIPRRCRVGAWRPDVAGISEVLHAEIVEYRYPSHHHERWALLIVDDGAISYDLDHKHCSASGSTVALLPPGVPHDGGPAAGTIGFRKRVLYLEGDTFAPEAVGRAVDRVSIDDRWLRTRLGALHDQLAHRDDIAAETSLSLVTERVAVHLDRHRRTTVEPEPVVARRLRLLLDDLHPADASLALAAERLGRSIPHLVRSFSSTYGIAPHAYVIARRVELARSLLLEGESPAIAASTAGFHDQAHLTRHFRRHTSVPPGVFQRSGGSSRSGPGRDDAGER